MIEVRIHVEDLNTRNLSRADRLLVLRAQLTLLRMRAEQGIPVTADAIEHAESLARSIEIQEIPA
jgi:hypothetical protein